ncbi:MAG: hypothetical protein FJ088_10965, partial [Deltaproteobacteria bacterium]|nr:hypothetical protein [Deltaproteobacteria bacterium]
MKYLYLFSLAFPVVMFLAGGAAGQEIEQATPEPVVSETQGETPAESSSEEPFFGEEESAETEEQEGEEEKIFQINGYIQNQTGIFFSTEKDKFDADELPTDHGDKFGKLSMFRNTLFIEADWKPFPEVSIHGIFRGVRSLKLDADKDAQVPEPGYKKDADKRIDWVYDNFYNETDLRELYVDIEASKYLSFRVGKQQVTWGDTGQYRLLDVINPIDSTWHFSALESFEDQRIPLWIFKALLDIPFLDGNLEFVWVPMLDDPKDLVTIPLTLPGAWGLPLVPLQEDPNVKQSSINQKIFMYPDNDIENSRLGARWKGVVGNLTYTFAYFYTHVISPPIPYFMIQRYGAGDEGYDVYLNFPRQHVAGLSLDYTLGYPFATILRFEAAYEPDRTYPVWSKRNALTNPNPEILPNKDAKFYFYKEEKQVLSYAVSLMRPTFIRFLNPEQSIMVVLQFMHSWILDFDPEEHILEIPGYDSTESTEHSFRLIGSVFTNYFHGLLTPRLVGIWIPDGGGAIFSGALGLTLGNHWRIN